MCERECTRWARPSLGLLLRLSLTAPSHLYRREEPLPCVLCSALPLTGQGVCRANRSDLCRVHAVPQTPELPAQMASNQFQGLYGLVPWKFLGPRVAELGLGPWVSVCILWAPLTVLWSRWWEPGLRREPYTHSTFQGKTPRSRDFRIWSWLSRAWSSYSSRCADKFYSI